MLGVMSLMFQASPCELNPLVQFARYVADSVNLDVLLVCCSGDLWRIEPVGPSTPSELNPLAPGDSIAVFGFVLSCMLVFYSVEPNWQGKASPRASACHSDVVIQSRAVEEI